MTHQTTPPRFVRLLWITAGLLAALLTLQLADRLTPSPAHAGVLSDSNPNYQMLTFNGGNEDVLAVLDNRAEKVFFYRVLNRRQVEFVQAASLPDMFSQAKRIGAGR